MSDDFLKALLSRINDATKPVDAADRNLVIRALSSSTRTQGADEALERALHYPDHWDTAAYPDVYSALSEVMTTLKCECERADDAQPVAIYQSRAKDVHCYGTGWRDVGKDEYDACGRTSNYERRIVYANRDAAPSDAAASVTHIQELMLKWINAKAGGPAKEAWNEIEAALRLLASGSAREKT